MKMFWIFSATFLILGIIILVISINKKDGQMILIGIIFIMTSILFYSIALTEFNLGYPADHAQLQANEVCEVIYTIPGIGINNSLPGPPVYVTLIQLSDGQFRLFQLNKEPVKGTVKVQNDKSLKLFTDLPKVEP